MVKIFLASLFLATPYASAEVVVVPTYEVPQRPVTRSQPAQPAMTVLQMLKQMEKETKAAEKEADRYRGPSPEAIERNYTRQNGTTPGFTAATDSGPFAMTAKECGEKAQRECSPAVLGRTFCGRAVARMIACMSKQITGGAGCTGACGHGKMFVKCENGQMGRCGYTKLSPTDQRCKQAGAVLAYETSPTGRGQSFGHVEFVCGDNKYCSVYSQPHDRPWPTSPPNACWFPSATGNPGRGS